MSNIASELYNGISVFRSFSNLRKICLTKVRKRITSPFRVEKLSDDLFSSVISYGSVVTVKGVLTRFGQTYRPLSYVPTIPMKASSEVLRLATGSKVKENIYNVKTSTQLRLFQFPVQTLPPFEDETGRYCLAFLYPEEFDSFILDEDPQKRGHSQADNLLITPMHRPIPVLLEEMKLENLSESTVTVTGVLSLLPEEVVSSISCHMCKTRSEFYYSFLRLSSRRIGFCLDCRDRLNSDFNQGRKLSSLPAALYVEGHFDGVQDDRYKSEFKESIPKGLSLQFAFADYPRKNLFLTQDEYVSVVGVEPSIFGFYTETNLADDRNMHNSILRLSDFYSSFGKSAANKVRAERSALVKFKPDFIFDFRRQKLFHPEGTLRSTEVEEVLKKDQELVETAEWLRKAE